MGQVKDWALDEEAQGFSSLDGRVCTECIEDEALQQFIRQEGTAGHACSYCRKKAPRTTQVVAEYLRFIHKGPEDQPIDGILYPSSRQKGAAACVLFIGPSGVCDASGINDEALLVLSSTETFRRQVRG